MRRLWRFLSPAEEPETGDLKEQSRDYGAGPPSECCDRSRVKVRGAVRWVTSLDVGGVGALLTGGMGSIEPSWTDRHCLDCITPGCNLIVQDRTSSGDSGRIMYNLGLKVVS